MVTKKKWFQILAPKTFGEKVIGETLSMDAKQLKGRKVYVSLMNLSKDFTRFYMNVIFQIERAEGDKAYTRLIGHNIMREQIYRMVQRRARRVDCIQDVTTKDHVRLRVKTVFVLVRRVNTSIKYAARSELKKIIDSVSSKMIFDDFMNVILKGDLQKGLKKDLSKIYPVGGLEIRKTELLAEMKAEAPKKPVKAAKAV